MADMIKAARWYSEKMGFSVIPIKKDKRPYIKWEEYQSRAPTEEEITEWWNKWPDANIGIVTGQLSNLTVIDVDTEEGNDKLEEILPSNLETPICTTPSGGKHIYFKFKESIGNAVRFLPGCDIRTQGGYVVAPPSENGNGKAYAWIPAYAINKTKTASMPKELYGIINNNSLYRGGVDKREGDITPTESTPSTTSTGRIREINFNDGTRDETLFHVANCLAKGGMPTQEIESLLTLIGFKICSPPFSEYEIKAKIKSALKRLEKKTTTLTQDIRDIICQHSGNITSTFVQQMTTLSTREEKKKVSVIMGRLEREGMIERTGKNAGEYRIVKLEHETVHINDVKQEEKENIRLPFNLESYVNICKGNLILVGGVTNAGKSAVILEIIRLNMRSHKCTYFSSEMSRSVVKRRVDLHQEEKSWDFNVVDNWNQNIDILKPGELNFIDWIEDPDPWKIPARLSDVQRKIGDGIGIVALQKNPNNDNFWGGAQTLNKASLALTIDHVDNSNHTKGEIIKVIKCKDYNEINPYGFYIKYRLYKGINFFNDNEWGP